SYLHMGVGLIIVDIVTERHANLHDELVDLLEQTPLAFPTDTPLYTVAYRPSRRETGDQIEIWQYPLTLGEPLLTMPLSLRGAVTVPVDLDETYSAICLDSRF